jgi:phosphopantetheinyl transferase
MDVEVLRPEWNMEFVAAMCLDEPQLRQLENFPPQEHQKQFLRFWTLREAFAKATGDGIAQPAADHISTASVWDCGFNASPPPPDWDWIQQWHRIGNHDVVISIARKIPADTATTSASSAVRRAD